MCVFYVLLSAGSKWVRKKKKNKITPFKKRYLLPVNLAAVLGRVLHAECYTAEMLTITILIIISVE